MPPPQTHTHRLTHCVCLEFSSIAIATHLNPQSMSLTGQLTVLHFYSCTPTVQIAQCYRSVMSNTSHTDAHAETENCNHILFNMCRLCDWFKRAQRTCESRNDAARKPREQLHSYCGKATSVLLTSIHPIRVPVYASKNLP